MNVIGSSGTVEAHDGDADSVERAFYRLSSAEREGAVIEVTEEGRDMLLQHPRSDVVLGTFMGCELVVA